MLAVSVAAGTRAPKSLEHIAHFVMHDGVITKNTLDSSWSSSDVRVIITTDDSGLLCIAAEVEDLTKLALHQLTKVFEVCEQVNELRLELKRREESAQLPTEPASMEEVFKEILKNQKPLPWQPVTVPRKDPYDGPWGPTIID